MILGVLKKLYGNKTKARQLLYNSIFVKCVETIIFFRDIEKMTCSFLREFSPIIYNKILLRIYWGR